MAIELGLEIWFSDDLIEFSNNGPQETEFPPLLPNCGLLNEDCMNYHGLFCCNVVCLTFPISIMNEFSERQRELHRFLTICKLNQLKFLFSCMCSVPTCFYNLYCEIM